MKPGFRSRLVNILKAHPIFQSGESNELVQVMEEANIKIEKFFQKEYTKGHSMIKDIENVVNEHTISAHQFQINPAYHLK